MPILAMDKFGQIYVTGTDRSDGLGFSAQPEMVREGDLTLGSAFKKAQANRRDSLLRSRRNQEILDAQDRALAKEQRKLMAQNHAIEMSEARLMENENIRKSVLKKALQMGCSCEYVRPLTGNVMTANGMGGFAGLSQSQQAITNHFTGRGVSKRIGIEPVEVSQSADRARVNQFYKSKSVQQERRERLDRAQNQSAHLGRLIHSPFRVISGRK